MRARLYGLIAVGVVLAVGAVVAGRWPEAEPVDGEPLVFSSSVHCSTSTVQLGSLAPGGHVKADPSGDITIFRSDGSRVWPPPSLEESISVTWSHGVNANGAHLRWLPKR